MAERGEHLAIGIVLFCALMWGFWWFPISLIEETGITGPLVGVVMNAAALPVAVGWAVTRRGQVSPRALLGSVLVGLAVTLYAVSVTYTDFLRAVLLFYLAPAWSTLIECIFLGRRWTLKSVVAILFSLAGVLLISRGDVSFDSLGAIGDWMALASGLSWSIGLALVFTSRQAEVSRVLVVTALGGIATALVIAWAEGSLSGPLPDPLAWIPANPATLAFLALYVGVLLAGTMWGAFRLPPAIMSYLLSVEVLGGVLSSSLILGETFGLIEAGGAAFIMGAVLIEVIATRRIVKPTG